MNMPLFTSLFQMTYHTLTYNILLPQIILKIHQNEEMDTKILISFFLFF